MGVGVWDRGQERLGVRVGRSSIEQVGTGDLAELAQVHDGDAVAHVLHHGQVVSDEHHGQPEGCLEVGQQVQDLGLDGHVEGGDRLVADQQLGLGHEGAGNADPLALTTGELARTPIPGGVGVDTHRLQGAAYLGRPLLLGAEAPDGQRLGHDVLDPAPGVERGDGVLEDHLDAGPDLTQLLPVQAGQLGPVEPDAS